MSQKYSPSEISVHSTKKDCWLVIHGKVYDVSTFMEDHPGGEEALLHASAIGDATDSFEEVGHSSSATNMMEDFLIGTVDGLTGTNSRGSAAVAGGSVPEKPLLEKKKASVFSTFIELLMPLLVLGLALGAWYYLTFLSDEKV